MNESKTFSTHVLATSFFCLAIFISCSTSSGNEDYTAPGNVSLLAPADATVAYNSKPTFTWTEANDPVSTGITYSFFLDTQNPPLKIVETDIEKTEFTPYENLLPEKTYYWQVEAKNRLHHTTKSEDIFSFVVSPVNGIIINENIGELWRSGHSLIVFKNKLWMFGGRHGRYWKKDVWNSDDGIHWNQVTESAAFYPREDHTSFAYDDKIWMIGGLVLGGFFMDVWYTEDGIEWVRATDEAPFQRRVNHSSVIFNDKMWVIAGSEISKDLNNSYERNDVWHSEDGVNWTQATENAAFHSRSGHVSVVFDNKMWVIGGATSNEESGSFEILADVWYSENGTDWTMATSDGGFGHFFHYRSVVFDEKIWLIGGQYKDKMISNEVWYSSDGENWLKASPFFGRTGHGVAVFNQKMWGVGGVGGNNPEYTDSWFLELP